MKQILLILTTFLTLACNGQETKQDKFVLTVSPIIDKTDKTNQTIIETLTEFLNIKNNSLTENKFWAQSDFQKFIYPYIDIYNIENEENYKNDKTQKIYDNYIKFTNETEDFFDFKSWFKDEVELITANLYLSLRAMIAQNEQQRKICENLVLNNLNLKNLSDFDYVFNTYIENIKQSNMNNKELVDRERNLKINKFIRDVYNMFMSLSSHTLSRDIIAELVSIIYDNQIDKSRIKKLIKKGNSHFTITKYEKKYISDSHRNIVAMEIVRCKIMNDFSL